MSPKEENDWDECDSNLCSFAVLEKTFFLVRANSQSDVRKILIVQFFNEVFIAKDGSWNLNFSIVWHLHLANHTANETPGFLQVSREENRTKMWSREQVLISWSPLLFVLRIFAIWEILVQQTCFVDFNLVETRTDYFSVTRCWNKKLMSETNFRVE